MFYQFADAVLKRFYNSKKGCLATLQQARNHRPTQRAPDLGYAPRFLSMFLAFAESRFEGESTLPPQAGNADR